MRRLGLGCLLLALASAGCGETGPTEGTTEFKSGNTDQLGPLQNQMMENMKNKSYMKGGDEPKKGKSAMPKGALGGMAGPAGSMAGAMGGAAPKADAPKAETPK